MPRPKGSKNKVTRSKAPRKITVANNDFEALIADVIQKLTCQNHSAKV